MYPCSGFFATISHMYWGFDIKSIDKKVRPQDDFYQYANGSWLNTVKIPADESRWGSFNILRFNTEHQLKKIVESAKDKLVGPMYTSASDMKTRNKLGTTPLLPLLKKVESINSIKDLLDVVAHLHRHGIGALWGTLVDQDLKNSERYLFNIWQSGLSLPDRDYYLKDLPEQKRVRDAYQVHIKKLLTLSGIKEIEEYTKAIMAIETALAQASMRKEDLRDPQKIDHKMSLAKLKKLSKTIDWARYFTQTDAKGITTLNVGQPDFLKGVEKLLHSFSIPEWKRYLVWHVLSGTAGLLSQDFVDANFEFYGKVLTGAKKMKPLWRRALGATNGTVGETVGQLYIKKHFPERSKKMMDELVSDLFEVYADRIRALDWMSPATKKKAVKKLNAMKRKIAYPTKWKGYKGLVIKKDDFFGNMLRSSQFEHKREMQKLKKKVDRTEWFMYPQTVNAYFSPSMNEIVFPAAILQWPFFDPKADSAINYAGIGSVIGHEMTHGFDDQGAKFDFKGNLKNWWTAKDKKQFDAKSQIIRKQYDEYKVDGNIPVNGQLTLGENIADLGGLAIAYDAYQKHLKKIGRKDIQGFSPEQRFFLGFAQMERELVRPEYMRMQVLTDPHSPAPFRINGPLANFEPFYETFGVTSKNKLYRKHHAKIW
ncbi:M13 family metallopeptidase [Candidatus Parcubacteria bacterium]|nr:M13 family metallopeptidase [Candidatus Parcubacteria bacterium]